MPLDVDSPAAQELVQHIQSLQSSAADAEMRAVLNRAEINRLRAALEIVREENNRAKRQFTNVSNKIIEDACSVLDSQ